MRQSYVQVAQLSSGLSNYDAAKGESQVTVFIERQRWDEVRVGGWVNKISNLNTFLLTVSVVILKNMITIVIE